MTISLDTFLYYTGTLLWALMIFVALGHIIYQKRSSGSMIGWMLFIFFVPVVAAPLYFLIGIRKRKSDHAKSDINLERFKAYERYELQADNHALVSILKQNGIGYPTKGNDFSLITDPSEAYEAMMIHIEKAQKTIELQTYVFVDDAMTRKMIDALTKRAKEGVKVRLLLDLVGSFGCYVKRGCFAPLIEAGGEVQFFVPILKHRFQSYINLRNHRKIYLFDRRVVLSGGMNLADEYMGPSDGTKRWDDIMYRIEGPAVARFFYVFYNDWTYAGGKPLEAFDATDEVFEGDSVVHVVPSGPDIPKDPLYEALLNAVYSAKERIWIATPYFIPDESLLKALIIARHKGVDVTLITPAHSDHLLTDLIRSSYMRELQENGIGVRLYRGEMLHAKAILVDCVGAMIGSLNIDNRSLFLNYEIVSFVYSEALIGMLEEWMTSLIARSDTGLPHLSKVREALENVMKVFAPLA